MGDEPPVITERIRRPDGSLAAALQTKGGYKHGMWLAYHGDGGRAWEVNYVKVPSKRDSVRHGRYREWYPGGLLAERRQYDMGEMVGEHVKWSELGEEVFRKVYDQSQ